MDYSFGSLEYLYIHWPFCPYKCNFCDFVALASHEQFMHRYHESLLREIKQFQKDHQQRFSLKTIYIGGGTPSTYPLSSLLDTFATLEHVFFFDAGTEVTLEVNPGTVKENALKTWKEAGINRLSIGVQSLKDTVLENLNRHQKAIQVRTLLSEASCMFENISVDFILGLPGVSAGEWKKMIDEAMQWPIKHISIYFLMVHEKTPLYFKVKKKSIVLPPDEEIIDLYYWTVDILNQHGFDRYELSNFAKKGFESKHNQAYWQRKNYKGFGLGACSFNGKVRFQNHKNLGMYLESAGDVESLVFEAEQLTQEKVGIEKIMLGLRQSAGVDIADIMQELHDEQQHKFLQKVSMLQEQGFVVCDGGKLYLTPQGFVLENEVAVSLFPE